MERTYWQNELEYPYAPSFENKDFYLKNLVKGRVLLLGCTHKLIEISNSQLDIDPWYQSETMIIGDWRKNQSFYENIIGDGVLNFSKEVADGVLQMCSAHCQRFIARTFNYKLPKMRYAAYFPNIKDFAIKPYIINQQKEYTFYVWNFSKS